jgi:CCR4-NOT transcription complex subunit 1
MQFSKLKNFLNFLLKISEIISPVVERAVNISLVTTRELIQKDFAFEKDDVKYRNAANLCIKSLAGSLAMVTCREPLRIGFNNQLKEIIGKKGFDLESILEPIYNSPNNVEILDIGCNYIQNFVIKRAIEKIEKDKTILEELEKRKKQKSIEVKPDLINKIKLLPESIRPSINGLTNEQFKIYEDFDKVYEKNKKEHQNKKLSFLKLILPAIKECLESYTPNQPIPKMINKYEICMFNVQFICKQNEPLDFSDAEDDEHLSSLSKLICEFKVSESIASELVLVTLKYVINFAKVSSMNLINIYSEILKGWVKSYPNFAKDITMKILNFDDVLTRYKFEIHYNFFKKGIFDIEDYENFIKKNLEDFPQYNYIQKLLNSLCEKNVINNHTFSKIPFYMISPKLSNNYYELFHKKIIFNNVNNKEISLTDYKVCNIRDNNSYNAFKEMCKMTIRQLTNLVFSTNNPQNIKTTMKQFIESSIVKSDEQMNAFMMLFTEFSVKSCISYNPDNIAFPESQAKTILILLNNITSPNKLKYFENILYGIFKIFHIDYTKNGLNFNQKPYFKIFFNLIHLIYTSDPQDEIFNNSKKYQFFFVILDFLRILKPQNYPAFANAWLELISCKYFSSIFLDISDVKSTKEIYVKNEKYILLIIDLMNYLKSFNNENINSLGVKIFIENVFKFLFLLSNSYPDYLSNYYYIIIASLPPGDYFLQFKNIILSSTPSDIEQPDPFFDEFKVNLNYIFF